jgi:hypothetical protein
MRWAGLAVIPTFEQVGKCTSWRWLRFCVDISSYLTRQLSAGVSRNAVVNFQYFVVEAFWIYKGQTEAQAPYPVSQFRCTRCLEEIAFLIMQIASTVEPDHAETNVCKK